MLTERSSLSAATIVLAGGQGTRLFPLTQKRCKPDVAFGGRYRLVNIPISNSINSGIHQIFVISQFFSSQLNFHINQTFATQTLSGSRIHFLHPEETPEGKIWYEGTADAIRKNLSTFSQLSADYFIILSGDQLYSMDLKKMLDFAIERDTELCIATQPIDKKQASRMGIMQVDEHAIITNFQEKPQDPAVLDQFVIKNSSTWNGKYLASMGIYIFKKSCLLDLLENSNGLDFGKDIIPYQLKHGKKSAAFIYDGYWEDIGTIESFYQANLSLTQGALALDLYQDDNPIFAQPNHFPSARIEKTIVEKSVICEGCIIEASTILHSLIGPRIKIGKHCQIQNCIILGNPISDEITSLPLNKKNIGNGCILDRVILDENVELGENVCLTNQQNLFHYDGDGLFVRDGIIVVASGKKLPDGFSF